MPDPCHECQRLRELLARVQGWLRSHDELDEEAADVLEEITLALDGPAPPGPEVEDRNVPGV